MEYCEYRLKNFGTCSLACSRRLDGGERAKSYAGKTREKKNQGETSLPNSFSFFLVDFFALALLSKRLEQQY